MKSPEEIRNQLEKFFDRDEVKWKPQTVKGNRAMAVAYIDARCVADRLDDVFGVDGWQDEYLHLGDGNVLCGLSCRFFKPDGGEYWIKKWDCGGPSEQPDSGDRAKAAVSDAFKRAAVKFGVGRYLYNLPRQWVDFDPAKRAFTKEPILPSWATPKADTTPAAIIGEEDLQEMIALAASKGYTVGDLEKVARVKDIRSLTATNARALWEKLSRAPIKGEK